MATYMFPRLPIFVGNVLLPEAPPIVYIPFQYFFPWFYYFIVFLTINILIICFFAYGLFVVRFAVTELRLSRRKYKTPATLREPEHLIMAYRRIQVLQQYVTLFTGPLIFPTQAVLTKLVIFCSYMFIKHHHDTKIVSLALLLCWGTISVLFWSGVLFMGGCLHFYGVKVLLSWKYYPWPNRYTKRLMGKFRKSCQPLQINYGRTYVIKKLSVPKFIRSLSVGILRVLLALWEKTS